MENEVDEIRNDEMKKREEMEMIYKMKEMEGKEWGLGK